MYAIVKTGGKQYRMEEGQVLRVERLAGEAGASVRFEDVLLLGDGDASRLGAPSIAGAFVTGTVVDQGRGAKVRVFKYKKRKHYRKTRGHRQEFTAVRIDKIQA